MKRGFTLPEMLVVVALLVFIVTTVLANTRDLGHSTRVKAAAGLIVDTAKDTRNDSVAVREFGTDRFPSYGIHFDMSAPQQITVFADCDADDNDDMIINNLDRFHFDTTSNQCNGGNGLVEVVTMNPAVRIKEIVATYPVAPGTMTTANQSRINILFLRPEPTLWITRENGTLLPAGKIEITVGDTANRFERTVTFYSTGEFSAE